MPTARHDPALFSYEVYDGTNGEAILAFAGDATVGYTHGEPTVNLPDGAWTVRRGWAVHRHDNGRVGLASPATVEAWIKVD